MITDGRRPEGQPILLKEGNQPLRLKRVPFEARDGKKNAFKEEWIQEVLREHPDILPVNEIEPVFAPLIAIGREVSTSVGSVDNLYLSPQGYITVVETKLWRNPEARREVVGQIIDYSKEICRWTYQDLELRVREYNKRYRKKDLGIIETLVLYGGIDPADEAPIIDTIARNLSRGRFLLLLVGDGIRESVEEMVDYLGQTPQLQFTLALIELQIYSFEDDGKTRLLLPVVVTRTKEITRAVVRVDAAALQTVEVSVEEETKPGVRPHGRFTLSAADFFEALGGAVPKEDVEFARAITEEMEEIGCVIVWRQSSYVVRLPDPREREQEFTIFGVDKDGTVFTASLIHQLRKQSLPEEIGYEFVEKAARLFKNCRVNRKGPYYWETNVPIRELREHYPDFKTLVQTAVSRIKTEAEGD